MSTTMLYHPTKAALVGYRSHPAGVPFEAPAKVAATLLASGWSRFGGGATPEPLTSPMTRESLETKDRPELLAIAEGLGLSPGRKRKPAIVNMILEAE